jgi:hypothetical protein
VKLLLSILFRIRKDSPRWPYILPAVVSFVFGLMAYDDAGWMVTIAYAAFAIFCIGQMFIPTLVGWIAIFAPCCFYLAEVAATPENGSRGEWLVFLAAGAVPCIALLIGVPIRIKKRTAPLSLSN